MHMRMDTYYIFLFTYAPSVRNFGKKIHMCALGLCALAKKYKLEIKHEKSGAFGTRIEQQKSRETHICIFFCYVHFHMLEENVMLVVHNPFTH